MKIYIVGIGMDGEKTLTAEARKAIENADVLIGAKRMTEPFAALNKNTLESWKADETESFLRRFSGNTAAVLMSGDCGFFSGAEKLRIRLADFDTEIIAGISTPVYMCSKLGLTWEDMRFVSLHGADASIARNVRRYEKCFFLLGGSVTPADICKRLCEYGTGGVTVHIGERLSYPDERLLSGKASELTDTVCGSLCAVVTVNSTPENRVRTGIPDTEFERAGVPMTKSVIRAAVASFLGVCYNDTVWDIGCGTGSVSVECALAANGGTVYAVDMNDEAVRLTGNNARKFGCDNIRTIAGKAPAVIGVLPRPDRVFIGGAGGNIGTVLDAAYADGNSPVTVITAVTLETLNEAVTSLKKRKLAVQVTQISTVPTKAVGSHTMFDAQNPVFIIRGEAL